MEFELLNCFFLVYCSNLMELEEKMTTTLVSLLSHVQHIKAPPRISVDASTMTEMRPGGEDLSEPGGAAGGTDDGE